MNSPDEILASRRSFLKGLGVAALMAAAPALAQVDPLGLATPPEYQVRFQAVYSLEYKAYLCVWDVRVGDKHLEYSRLVEDLEQLETYPSIKKFYVDDMMYHFQQQLDHEASFKLLE